MKQKRVITAILALALAALCCGCGAAKETPEQVAQKMQEALAQTPCGQAELVMDISMTLDAGEYGTMDMSTTSTSNVTVCQDPSASYTVVTNEVDYGGEKSQTVAENYTLTENGEIVSYIKSSGIWMKYSMGQSAEGQNTAASVSMDAASVAIDETVTQWEGKDAICLTSQMTGGDQLESVMDAVLGSIGQGNSAVSDAVDLIDAADYSALACSARIYLDPETYLPMAEEMTFTGVTEVMAPIYEQMGVSVDVTSFTATAHFLSYEAQPEITLPEGAEEKAEAWTRLLAGEPDNGDGTYTIREGAVLVDITAPEGFELVEKDYDHVYFERDDYREVNFTMYYGSAEDLTATVDSQESFYSGHFADVSREQATVSTDTLTFQCDMLNLAWTSYEQGKLYAWADLGSDGTYSYFLFVEVNDGYNSGLVDDWKTADITAEEFIAYLNAATVSDLME